MYIKYLASQRSRSATDPIEMIYAAGPHLFGNTPKEAANRIALMRLMSSMRPEAVDSLLTLVGELAGESSGSLGTS